MRRLLHWVPELVTFVGRHRARSQIRLLGAAIAVGIVAGIAAILFYVATATVAGVALGQIVGYSPEPHPAGEPMLPWLEGRVGAFRPWLLFLVPALGGLASGIIVFTLAPEAEGHGTDAVIAAYHHHEGRIRTRVPLVKVVASALTIGTGGSGGREGPIAQIGAGFGSLLAGCSTSSLQTDACCALLGWEQASRRSSARRSPALSSRPRSSIGRPSSSRKRSSRRASRASSRIARSAQCSGGSRCSRRRSSRSPTRCNSCRTSASPSG